MTSCICFTHTYVDIFIFCGKMIFLQSFRLNHVSINTICIEFMIQKNLLYPKWFEKPLYYMSRSLILLYDIKCRSYGFLLKLQKYKHLSIQINKINVVYKWCNVFCSYRCYQYPVEATKKDFLCFWRGFYLTTEQEYFSILERTKKAFSSITFLVFASGKSKLYSIL